MMRKVPGLRPMSEFDPARPSTVHDALNDRTFAWKPEWAPSCREDAIDDGTGAIGWDGLLLDGWSSADVVDLGGRRPAPQKSRSPG